MPVPWLAIGLIASAAAAGYSGYQNKKANREAMDYAKEQDRNRVKWMVEDAERAGIHPLSAVGGGVPSGGIPNQIPMDLDMSGVNDALKAMGGKARLKEEMRWQEWFNQEELSKRALENNLLTHQIREQILKNNVYEMEYKYGKPGSSPSNSVAATKWWHYDDPKGERHIFPMPTEELAESMEGKWPGRAAIGMNIDWDTYKKLLPDLDLQLIKKIFGD